MTAYNENYKEETNLLFKALRTDGFRFVIVKYNHYSLVQKLKEDLKDKFPNRSSFTIDAEKTDYKTFVESYYNLKEGFFFVENFDKILEDPELYAGINQRRDKLANYPIALIAFISPSAPTLYARQIMEKMPDLWSFRSLMIELEMERKVVETASFKTLVEDNIKISSLGGTTRKEKIKELERLDNLLKSINDQNDTSLLESILEQKATLQTDLGKYTKALETLDLLIYMVLDNEDEARFLLDKGDIYKKTGDISSSLKAYIEGLELLENSNNYSLKSLMLHKIGVCYALTDNFQKALEYFNKFHKVAEENSKRNPNNLGYKLNFVVSYQSLGELYFQKNMIEEATTFFNKFHEHIYKIYTENKDNEIVRVSLGESYRNLGNIYYRLDNWERALFYFKQRVDIYESIFKSSDNIDFVLYLSDAYNKLAQIYSDLGEMNEASLVFEKITSILEKSTNINRKNVDLKNMLAVAYANLGLHLEEEDIEKSYFYNIKAKKIWEELVKESPANQQYHFFLEKINQDLERIKNQTS